MLLPLLLTKAILMLPYSVCDDNIAVDITFICARELQSFGVVNDSMRV